MNAMPLAAIVLVLIAPLTLASGGSVQRKNINDATLAALQAWVQAVNTHTPGRADASVVAVAAYSHGTREDLNSGMNLFLAALMARTVNTEREKARETIVAMGRAAGRDFLKRAAVLHSDAAAYGDLVPHASTGGDKASAPRTQEVQIGQGGRPEKIPLGEPIPPLLMADRIVLDKDGQVLGEVLSTWNWPFARSLLDLLSEGRVKRADGSAERATDPFIAAWYHATTAYMFASGLYGEATPHLHHAAEVLPDDARILFDRGCYAEILGLPMHQALLPDRDAGPSWIPRSAWDAPTGSTNLSGAGPRIPTAEKTNAEAERLFRRALAIDPSLVEARVRLARLLGLRKRHEEAASELKTALAGNPRPAVAFYAHLFAGRAAQAMGRADEASRHYQDATALFPDAQSALLASSQLSLLGADVAATLRPVQRLGARSTEFTADPWWQYHLAAGRHAEDLLKRLWTMVPR